MYAASNGTHDGIPAVPPLNPSPWGSCCAHLGVATRHRVNQGWPPPATPSLRYGSAGSSKRASYMPSPSGSVRCVRRSHSMHCGASGTSGPDELATHQPPFDGSTLKSPVI
eukprot:165261-Prymnesium_polylepis.1